MKPEVPGSSPGRRATVAAVDLTVGEIVYRMNFHEEWVVAEVETVGVLRSGFRVWMLTFLQGSRALSPDPEISKTLVELAEQGDEATFKDLARSLGMRPEEYIDGLWQGTLARVRQRRP